MPVKTLVGGKIHDSRIASDIALKEKEETLRLYSFMSYSEKEGEAQLCVETVNN